MLRELWRILWILNDGLNKTVVRNKAKTNGKKLKLKRGINQRSKCVFNKGRFGLMFDHVASTVTVISLRMSLLSPTNDTTVEGRKGERNGYLGRLKRALLTRIALESEDDDRGDERKAVCDPSGL